MRKITTKISLMLGIALLASASCTKLEEETFGSRQEDQGGEATASDLQGVYQQLNGQTDQANTYALQEHSTDEMMGPTRGTDWGDFGTWRKLHQHTWDASHNQINDTWDQLNIGVFRATQVIDNSTSNQIKGEASFLRAWFMFQIIDLFGQAPFRDPKGAPSDNPTVFTRPEALEFIIKDLVFAETNLGQASMGKASKAAAQALLAKAYLNKPVYTATTVGGPFTFAKADMDKVIEYANKVSSAGYQLVGAGKYFDNFSWDNSTLSKELIFGIENTETAAPGAARNRWRMTMHYNSITNKQEGGWNGFTTLADFYKTFEASDERRGGAYPGLTNILGLRTGFLIGQQFGVGNQRLTERGGKPLVFTENVNINFSTEAQGIRVIKYFPKPAFKSTGEWNDDVAPNDYIFLRYADVLLMKAEAILRGGTDPQGQTVVSIVNSIRTPRGATSLASVDANALLAERGRELYWEGWRRNDLIRFERFNIPVDQRPNASEKSRTLFPIPQRAVDTNPNLTQNPGY